VGALELSPGVASEAYSIAYWCHVYSPLDCWSVYETLTDGLIAAKQERWAALAVHDHDRADRALQEVRDLTELCAAAAEGLASMRLRFFHAGHRWPLARLP
jgi:hypothetical protein